MLDIGSFCGNFILTFLVFLNEYSFLYDNYNMVHRQSRIDWWRYKRKNDGRDNNVRSVESVVTRYGILSK